MRTMKTFSSLIVAAVIVMAIAIGFVTRAGAASVEPVVVPGNPNCTSLGYDFGFKPQPEPPGSGTYFFPDGVNSVTIDSDGVYFDWSSTLGVDAVLVKGGDNANAYIYDPPAEAFADTYLHSPINPNNGQPYEISHIDFCYDYEVDVAKDAATTYTRTYLWDIAKSVTPDTWWMFAGDSDTSGYTVDVTQTGYQDSDWAVSGSITVANNTPFDATITGVADEISGAGAASVDCGVAFPYLLAAGGTLVCSYSSALPDGSDRLNTATATTEGIVGGNAGTADVIFGDPTTEVNATVNVSDSWYGDLGEFSGSGSATYDRTFTCSSNPADYTDGHLVTTYPNTATIDETGQNSSASVDVHCYIPDAAKDAATTYTRTFLWDIAKSVDPDEWAMFAGDSGTSNYTVEVTQTGYEDSDWHVSGTITVHNPNPMADLTVGVSDVISPDIVPALSCGGSLLVPAGGSATCDYEADLPDATDRLNTATVTMNGIDFTATAAVTFGDPSNEVNPTVNVSDSWYGDLGEFSDSGSATYDRTFTCSDNPADYTDGHLVTTYPNTATIDETGQNDSASVDVHCYIPDVAKDAHTFYTRTYLWDIAKSVDPAEWAMFAGDSGTSDYLVEVTQTGYEDSDWFVTGSITVHNPNPTSDLTVAVSDVISPDIAPTLSCGGSLLVPAGGSATCDYEAALPDAADRVNTATITMNGIEFTATADVTFGDPSTEVNPTVNVSDSWYGDLGEFSGSGSAAYDRTFTCSSNPADYTDGHLVTTYPNTATIDETGQNDSASVDVHCYIPDVAKDAHTSYNRDYSWTIDKMADASDLLLMVGQQFLVNYQVTVDAAYTDSGWAVNGSITVYNPHPAADVTVTVSDVISPDIVPALSCGGSLLVPAGGSASCDYEAALPDGADRVNTATISMNGIEFTATAAVTFGDPSVVTDECITVNDDQYGALGEVCADQAPATFNYSMYIGPYDTCGLYQFVNTASFVTNDTGASGSDSWTVNVDVPCVGGCTLTQGYWKTHSSYGPAPYNDTWALVGEDTPFYLSGQSWYELFWTAPQGNAYYILAHQYMAATLNQLNGAASTPEVDAALAWAADFFSTHTPSDNLGPLRNQALQRATLLDNYNNGLVGPGHCSE